MKQLFYELCRLAKLGQSIWFDYIRRSFIINGDLRKLIDQGLRGITSNPTIFEKAIAGSADYDSALKGLASENKTIADIYEVLVTEDIAKAADLFRPVYEETESLDGFVSLEVNPNLAHDTEGTIQEARRLFALLNRPNVMIKVPATDAGIPAITALISEGISVNVTLMFNMQHYGKVANAYLTGLEQLLESGGDVSKVASVASFFISRIDSAVDKALEEIENKTLLGKIAIANAKDVYQEFLRLFNSERWQPLSNAGARVQRVLWASTGTKNPLYPDTKYIESLIGKHTVNTLPPATLNAFLDHGVTAVSIENDPHEVKTQLAQLKDLGIDLAEITEKLQKDGLASFSESFEKIMHAIDEKRQQIVTERKDFTLHLGKFLPAVSASFEILKSEKIILRIWQHDFTVWKSNPAEITNRLGWLHSPDVMMEAVDEIESFVDSVQDERLTHALLLGMGGSSLAPEVFRLIFGVKEGYLDLKVLDSTNPGAVSHLSEDLDPEKTLYIVSTKSGGTVETLSFMKYFYNRVLEKVGKVKTGDHFIAITDPGSGLEMLAKELSFRKIFLNDPNIGGRYSALSYFGLVPAGLIGVDLKRLLDLSQTIACNAEGSNCPVEGDNSSARLGAVMGELAKQGRDKLTFITSPAIEPFGSWVEQLIAESTGKQGVGILPVVGETVLPPDDYADDRLFIYLRYKADPTYDGKVQSLIEYGYPLVTIDVKEPYDLGGEFFRWEMATAVAGYFLKINPFDQPNVESAKVLAKKMVAAFHEEGKLPEPEPSFHTDEITVYTNEKATLLDDVVKAFFARTHPGQEGKGRSYVTIQAFIQPNEKTLEALQELRSTIQEKYGLATTLGYGPRFLHSTGQLHKGDGGNGLFIQITCDQSTDLPIPDNAGEEVSSMTFGVLALAQAMGDRQALLEAKREIIRFHISEDPVSGIRKLKEIIE